MKRILFGGLVALAIVGLSQAQASAVCFDKFRPCVKVPLPRLPLFLPSFCIGCDPEGRQGHCGSGGLLYNKSCCYANRSYPCGNVDCNRPMYPNPGLGYMCWHGQVGPWYNYYPPGPVMGYQVGGYGAFRGPAGAGYAPAVQHTSTPSVAYNSGVPAYWYGR